MRAALLSLVLAGCASTSAKEPFDDVAKTTAARLGHTVRWDQNTTEDRAATKAIDDLLARELTADAAVQIALLASPEVRAKLEELAIGQADLVQAGLLSNPVFTVGSTAWEMEHIAPNLFGSVEQSFLEIVTLPMKKRVAATELERVKLEVGWEILELAAHVRTAFHRAQAAEQVAKMRVLVDEAQATSAELAKRQLDAGNINELAFVGERALAAQASLDRRHAEVERVELREEVNKHLGLWGKRTAWTMAARLPELPASDPAPEGLEARAIRDRLDVAALRRQSQAIGSAITLAKTTRWTGSVNVSVEAGRMRSSKHVRFGPSVALEIPLFDQRRAAIARLEAAGRQTDDRLQQLAIDVRADVRATSARVVAARAIVEDYRKTIVPLRENAVRLTQQQYDAMLVGVYQLIGSKQAEFNAYREYIEALRDYWIARSDLELTLGSNDRQEKK